MMKIKVILIGAGNRGARYTDIMADMPEKYEVVAVAEPIQSRRNYIKEKHGIPEKMCFATGEELLALGKIADAAVIATMDRDHYELTMQAISLKYDLLLEKPVSPDAAECKKIAEHANEMGVKVVVCHVLRYSPFFITLKEAIVEGKIGDIISINHEECVGNVHQSHSFVRGNWGNTKRSSIMLLQKSCHDIDILQWLIGKKCEKVQSFGSLSYFKKENAPKGSPEYCIEGCPEAEKCPYNAVKIYLDDKKNDWFRTTCTREAHPTDEMVEKALRTTQYGKCVFKCDNDVVDHQIVNLLYEDGITANFSMNAFNKGGRFIHIMGTKGELRGAMDSSKAPITLFDFETRETTEIPIRTGDGITSGHGGGDEGIVRFWYEYLVGTYDGVSISDISISVDNHLTVFAAEKSREERIVVDVEVYKASLE
ncbi:MAG: Gfo/Idh/MocA family oxidoreductase [Lachnospiraceae bacterium]|nr:Gfo/Idh/MocA family oxidoreductase [Lachnospiraceae bacterium]